MTGSAGLSGAAALARQREKELKERLPGWLTERVMALAQEEERRALKPPGEVLLAVPIERGGVFRALWDLAEKAEEAIGASAAGLRVALADIPVRQEVIEICEVLGENPYQLPAGGWLFLVREGWRQAGRVIGHTTQGPARVIEGPSGVRYLEKPRYREETT